MNGLNNYFVVFLAVMHLCVQLHASYVCNHDDLEMEEVCIRNLLSFCGAQKTGFVLDL